ncbi:phage Gp37/Gp68 family protein [Rhizobium sp. RU36D]|uniref:DUF5131 family protein n=1 Tax=Rhizobium sp. RU36D TaxID=1907415 RepID=UPI0009D8B279|nr:phage Gp37/Gp68 family protein [Rhizobium sp. RU36D]SMD18250.1 protein gp37 [Rhizobium sp. RU36D]
MAENSAISWTRHTWNPWMGCTKVSPACDGCYAEALMDKRYAKVRWGNFPRARTGAKTWNDPHRWNKQAVVDGDRPFVFCASLADIFDNQVPTQWRTDAFEVMRNTPRLVYLLLTKRPQNIVRLSMEAGGLPVNAALGTTCEDQPRADKNLPALLSAHDRVNSLFTFLSCEPLLGPIDLSQFDSFPDWVIAGGETDQGEHKARPTHPDWLRDLRDACAQVGVPFHLKQWGEWTPGENVPHTVRGRRPSAHFFDGEWDIGSTDMSDPEDGWMDEPDVYRVGKKLSGRMLDGVTHDAFPQVPA